MSRRPEAIAALPPKPKTVQRPLEADQPSDETVVAGVGILGMPDGNGSVQRQFGCTRNRRNWRHLQAGAAQPAGADGDQQRLDGQLATLQRIDPGRDEIRSRQFARHPGHWPIAAAAASTLSRNDAGSIAG